MSIIADITNQKFGKLTVLGEAYRKRNVYWNCLCECGNKTVVMGVSLRNGHTNSCGCAKIDSARNTAKKKLSTDPRITSARNVYGNHYKDGNLTFEQFLALTQKECFYCGSPPNKSNIYNRYKHRKSSVLTDISSGDFYYNGLDRIDNTKSHDVDNVVPCCKWCNSAKMNRTMEEFMVWIEKVYYLAQMKKPSFL